MKYVYPAIFHKEDGEYWVDFPDLTGCFSDGESEADAVLNASEALEGYLATVIEDGKTPAKPSDIKNVKTEENSFCSLVAANVPENSVKKTLTIPASLNSRAEALGLNFSKVLQDALKKKIETA